MIIKNSNGNSYEVLAWDSIKDYALLKQVGRDDMYIVTWCVNGMIRNGETSWGQGHYFTLFENAYNDYKDCVKY